MKNLKFFSTVAFLLVCSCSPTILDEKYTKEIFKKQLSIQKEVSIQKVTSGLSGSKLFLANDGKKKYVVKYIKGQEIQKREIYNSKIAFNCGYGPKIYFTDELQGILIMEYISGKISVQDLQSDQIYIALALLLQKIHQGKSFVAKPKYDPFDLFDKSLQNYASRSNTLIPLTKIKHIIAQIHQALLPHLTAAPCHNDLYAGNLMFYENECKAIDFADAGPGDPYFDLATVACCTHIFPTSSHEDLLFTTYLRHTPSAQEKAKLYLMKQVILIKWILRLDKRCPETDPNYDITEEIPVYEVFKGALKSPPDLSDPKNNVKLLKGFLKQLFENVDSPEFQAAILALNDLKTK